MHFKQASLAKHFLEDPVSKNRNVSLHQQNQSSLEQSPIPTKYREDSDQSPEQYLYPQSLQLKNLKFCKVYDLKQRIIDLLQKLKHWLQQLCLSEGCITEVNEQLEPIIDQIKEINQEQSSDSCWFSCLPYANEKKYQNSLILKQSENNCQNSMVTSNKHAQYIRNQSILIHESRQKSQIWLINQSQKNLVKIFFKKYYRLLQNSLHRISKYSGQKKLKFLLQTNIRNIFSQTLRISYDLKLIQFKLKQDRLLRARNNRTSYINLLSKRIEMIFRDKGGIKLAFTTLKYTYSQQVKKDNSLVTEMISKIGKMCKIYAKNTQYHLQNFTYKWRQSAYKLKIEQEITLVDCIRMKIYNILSDLVSLGNDSADFSAHWRFLIESNMNSFCSQLFQDEDCFFIGLQEIMNERYSKREKSFTLADFIEDGKRDNCEGLEKVCSDISFLRQLTIQQLRACILSGQIYRNQKSEHNLLLVPIKPASGIFFVKLESQNQSQSDLKTPMKLSSFRRLLRIVELITPIIEDVTNICKRIQVCWQQTEKQEHYSLLFKQFLKADLVNNQEGHLQLECKSSEIEIDSNRLHSSAQAAKNILQRCNIESLMIYHYGKDGINDLPCIVFGDSELALSQRYIIRSIYEELLSSGKNLLAINRNGQLFNIIPLHMNNIKIGFVNYLSTSSEKIDNQMISQCLVPLLLKCEGKISCEHCKVSLKLPDVNVESLTQQDRLEEKESTKIGFDASSQLVTCNNLQDIEIYCSKLLNNKGNFFFKMLYKIDLSDLDKFYSISAQGQLQLHQLKQSEQIIHKQMFIEDYSSLTNCSTFAKLVFNSPCFPNPQLYIYQNESQHPLRVVAIPIKNNKHHFGYFLSAFYHMDAKISEQFISYLSNIVDCLNLNSNVFTPIQLNNSKFQNIYKNQQQKQNELLHDLLFNAMDKPKHGKLSEMFDNCLMNLQQKIQNINNKKYQCSISAFKINSKCRKIRVLTSTKNRLGEIKVHEDIVNLLNQNNLICTHEMLISNECRIKKMSFNRTIKPIKNHNFNNTSIFLPNLSQKNNQKLFDLIKNKFKLKGLVSNEFFEILSSIDEQLTAQVCKKDQMYGLLKIGKHQNRNQLYFVLIKHDIVDPHDKNILNLSFIEKSLPIFTKIFQQSTMFQPSESQKKVSIQRLNSLISRKFTVYNTVKGFQDNWIIKRSNIMKLCGKLDKLIANSNKKNILYYKLLQNSFSLLKKLNQIIIMKNQIFFERISPKIDQIQNRFLRQKGFRALYELTRFNCSFNHQRSVNKINNVIIQTTKSTLKYSILAISYMGQLRSYNKFIDRSQAVHKIQRILSNIQKKEHFGYFFNQIHKMHLQFINSFDLIAQQFQSHKFNSKLDFIIFANQRYETILRHISYSLVYKIQIGLAQIAGRKLIIYLLDQEKQLIEKACQKPDSFEPQFNNNYHFLSIKTQISNNNYLIYKIYLKENSKYDKEASIVRNSIINGIVPCYQKYLQNQLEKAERICSTVLNITCKQMWNGALDEAQKIYAFGRSVNYEDQSCKIKAFTAIKHFKRTQMIKQLKMIRSAINEETKQYYRLQYEYNSIGNAIFSGIPTQIKKDDTQIFQKYQEFISKDRLKEQRQLTQKMEMEFEKRNLHYQIKSKTYATSKILMFCDKKEKEDIQKTNASLLMNEQKENLNKNNYVLEKAIVEEKMKLSRNNQKQKNVIIKQKIMSTRSILLILNNISKCKRQKDKKQAFMTIAWPKGSRIRS